MRLFRRGWWIVLVCLVVATVSTATGFVVHTDDGCPTEIHCTACRTGLAGTAIQVAVAGLAPVASIEIAPVDPAPSSREADTPRTPALRGPPIA